MARTGQPATRQVAAVQRAVTILGELADARAELGTNEIARRTGINVSTISRILATLVSGGLVEHVTATGRYRLGLGVVRLASAVHERLDIRILARPHLAELASRTRRRPRCRSRAGTRRPRWTSCRARCPCAAWPRWAGPAPRTRPRWARSSSPTAERRRPGAWPPIPSARSWTRPCSRSRWPGPGTGAGPRQLGEREEDLNAIAVPVLNPAGTLVAILGMQGPAVRFSPRAMRSAVELLMERAERISSAL